MPVFLLSLLLLMHVPMSICCFPFYFCFSLILPVHMFPLMFTYIPTTYALFLFQSNQFNSTHIFPCIFLCNTDTFVYAPYHSNTITTHTTHLHTHGFGIIWFPKGDRITNASINFFTANILDYSPKFMFNDCIIFHDIDVPLFMDIALIFSYLLKCHVSIYELLTFSFIGISKII